MHPNPLTRRWNLAACLSVLFLSPIAGEEPRSNEDLHVHTFRKVVLTEDFYAEGAHFGDFDRDGHGDIVYGPFWYAGPDFEERHEIYEPKPFDKNGYSDNFFAWTEDFDEDGWTDVLVVGFPGKDASWYENPRGEERRWKRHRVFDGVDNESPHWVDITGDGRRELVFHYKGRWGWTVRDGSDPAKPWSFHAVSPKGNYQRFTHGMGVGDVNGDGRLDILEKNGWWEHPAGEAKDGSFWELHRHDFAPGGYGGAQMYAYDFDGDGDNDVVAAPQAHAHGLYWFEQVEKDGGIGFVPRAIMDPRHGSSPKANRYGVAFSQPHAMDLVDMDRDGIADLVTGKRYWAHNGHDADARMNPVLYWFKTARTASGADFVPFLIDGLAGVGTQVVAGDVNGDGWPDVVVGNKAGAAVLIHEVEEVDREEYRRSFPRPFAHADVETPPSEEARGRPAGVLPRGSDGEALDLGFESGTLAGWKAEGEAFRKMPLEGDATVVKRRRQRANHQGSWWIGTYEIEGDRPQGTLTSVPFEVTHPFASFLVGGGHHRTTCVEIVGAGHGEVIFRASGADAEPMRRVVADLRDHQGKEIRVRLVDRHSGHWGHINYDDFRFHTEPPRPVGSEAEPLVADVYPHAGLSPEEAAKAMTLPYGFRATVFAAEPDVKQPIAFTIDERGRLWVAEAYSYPVRRPDGEARDRILIFEDEDGDGRFDTRKVFRDGLDLVSGLEVGFGGVWVGAAPHLLFIPDRDQDDVPDGEPEVVLDGWGYQDTHETLNAFIWGPDGWLYGCHGVFTHSNVGKPGDPPEKRQKINAGIWRFHPLRREFEVYAFGTSNPWGIDWNDRGQAFLTACVIPHLFHVVQGARYRRQAGRHFNPHVYDDIKTIADHRHYVGQNPHGGNNRSDSAGGGHAHCGAMVYLGDAWPQSYRNRLFMNNVHGQRVNVDLPVERGSGYAGFHADDFLLTGDRASQGLNLKYGPDGQVYLIDWYDMNACHRREIEAHDRSNGRIYKITYGESRRGSVDLRELEDLELAELMLHPNEWHVRTARRLLQERSHRRALDPRAAKRLEEIASGHAREERRLRGLWTLHATNLLTETMAQRALGDYSPYVRGWAIELIMEDRNLSERSLARFTEMARKDRSPVVRLYLASALQRLPHDDRWEILEGLLAHAEDAGDHNLPLMYWYGAEELAGADPARALALASRSKVPLILGYMVRRIGSAGTPESVAMLVEGLRSLDDPGKERQVLAGVRAALRGRRRVPMPEAWPAVYEKLRESEDPRVRGEIESLAVTFGDPEALASQRRALASRDAPLAERRAALESLLAAKDEALAPALHALLDDPALRGEAIRALAAYDDPRTPGAILRVYGSLDIGERRDALNTLASRVEYAGELLDAVGQGAVPAKDVTAEIVRQLRHLENDALQEKLEEVWGVARDPSEDKAPLIAELREKLRSAGDAKPDPRLGRAVFAKTCAQCHALFGAGGKVGPELTGANRSDLDYLLSNIIDPGAVLAKEYRPFVFITSDGRVLTGLILEETPNAYTIATANDTVVLPKGEIISRELSESSMMPDDLLSALSEEEVRALFAYLASPSQVPMRATPYNVASFFNGKDLSGWTGTEELWSVEDGEIVGKSPGLGRNEFLRNDLELGDFRLRVRVKLTPNAGNSGIQFRSEALPGGEVKGYQADIGEGWWGKLYEEHGRALLWEKPGDRHVKVEDWNDYEIVASGSRIRTYLNGNLCVDLDDPEGARRGIVALQIHSGPPMEVRFKDFRLEIDPAIDRASGR